MNQTSQEATDMTQSSSQRQVDVQQRLCDAADDIVNQMFSKMVARNEERNASGLATFKPPKMRKSPFVRSH